MKRLVLESWLRLIQVDLLLHARGITAVHEIAGKRQSADIPAAHRLQIEELCRSMDLACVFYFKRVLCLQRSAATAILLARHGWRPQIVIGVQMLPFRSHAWIEVDGAVVNDKSYVRELYTVLQQC